MYEKLIRAKIFTAGDSMISNLRMDGEVRPNLATEINQAACRNYRPCYIVFEYANGYTERCFCSVFESILREFSNAA